MELKFSKFHGLGNDFVMIDDMDRSIELTSEQVVLLCDRHFGIGADGVILVRPSQDPRCIAYMHYINADGTLAEMCGNGIRCFAKFLIDHDYVNSDTPSFMVGTKRGPLTISVQGDDSGAFSLATVDMDTPIFHALDIPTTLPESRSRFEQVECVIDQPLLSPWGEFRFTCVSMGNPHAVCFLDSLDDLDDECFLDDHHDLESFDVDAIGSYFESHEVFPAHCNIEFIVVASDGLHMRVYERGCGETLACGTGACASLVAAVVTGRSLRHNVVHLRGGILDINWNVDDHVYMTGPAEQSFSGTVQL